LQALRPKARESGKFRGQRRIGHGRDVVRRLLYMSALSLWRTSGPANATQRRMQQAEKPAKVILIAMARKIVTFANAVLRDQTPFRTAVTG
jgi:transposase